MSVSRWRWFAVLAALVQPGLLSAQSAPTYADVAPLLAGQCVMCHSGAGAPLGLRLDSLEGIKAGSSRGPVVKAGQPDDSELIRRLRGDSQPRMPLTGPPWMGEADVRLFADWIAAGLPDAPAGSEMAPAGPPKPAAGEAVNFAHVEHLFMQSCVKCHKVDGIMGAPPEGLRLQTYADVLNGNDRVVVVPGNPAASKLLRRIKGYESPRMPYDGPPWLSAEDTALIERWIADGARDTSGNPAPMPVGRELRLEGVLGANWRLQDFVIDVEPGTRIKKSPSPGDEVRVRGRVQADGSVLVTRVRGR